MPDHPSPEPAAPSAPEVRPAPEPPAARGAPRSPLGARLALLYRWGGPIFSLASGTTSVVLFRRGVEVAPIAALVLVVAWLLAAFALARRPAVLARGVGRFATTTLVTTLYQNVLFFLVPIYAGSATWPSWNALMPLGLGALAVFSCVDPIYVPHVLEHPARRTAVSSLILFSVLTAATPIVSRAPLEASLSAAAIASTLAAAATSLPKERLLRRGTLGLVLAAAIVAGFTVRALAPLLPPVPLDTLDTAATRELVDREPRARAEVFDAGTERVYAWFAIAAPEAYGEKVRFVWLHDGEAAAGTVETTIVGGRKTGFRTWAYKTRPERGAWTVELRATSGQLIARQSFTVR